ASSAPGAMNHRTRWRCNIFRSDSCPPTMRRASFESVHTFLSGDISGCPSTTHLCAISSASAASSTVRCNTFDIRCTVVRSEEHTSELQSRFDLVCRLLLEKKKLINSIYALCRDR